VPPGDAAHVQLCRELRVTGRRRGMHRWMAIVVGVLGALVTLGSSLPWTHFAPGGHIACHPLGNTF